MISDSQLYAPLLRDPDIALIFSDAAFVQYMLTVEVALAKVQASLNVIPSDAAGPIIKGVSELQVDMQKLQTGVNSSSVPVIELIKLLREQVGGEIASYVHWGATSQDIMDTALILQIRASLEHIESHFSWLIKNLTALANEHRKTLMAGRTHSQQALPIPFGLKVAGWLAPLSRHQQRLSEFRPRLFILQFGGAVGTLAALGDSGPDVLDGLAHELGLGVPAMSWHTQRDNLVEFAGWLSLVTGSLAKMAQDIILMTQSEIGEVHESSDPSRGGSSTMPQKRNPIISEVIIAAARTNATLLSAMHQAMIQEHERATHGWQMEWLNLPQMVNLTATALRKAVFLSENLVVDRDQMQKNVAASNGLMLAEAISFALVPIMGREKAKALVKAACQIVLNEHRHLFDVIREKTDADIDWKTLRDESAHLGSSDVFIDRVLKEAKRETILE